jgi:Dyp-type peroxidase family
MPVNVDQPLRWKTATGDEVEFLSDLQGNILKNHGREHTRNIFLQFDPSKKDETRAFIRQVGAAVTSAYEQFADTERFKLTGADGGPFIALFLTAAGYKALGIATNKTPNDPSFQSGLKVQAGSLQDPAPNTWDTHFRGEIHAMILIGTTSAASTTKVKNKVMLAAPKSIKILGEEIGKAYKNKAGDGLEHFGYVDGRSQPLMLVEDIEKQQSKSDGIDVWDPKFGLKTAVVPCPGGNTNSFGSYFVFRKLEQNVKGFKAREQDLATALGLGAGLKKGSDTWIEAREVAGAYVVGRFEDGTPVVLHDEAQNGAMKKDSVPNNFDYSDDTAALKCPFQGHIRKSNPRGESVGPFASSLEEERSHIMARRGITYGERQQDRKKEFTDVQTTTGNVGLLFMAYQNDIGNQFEFTQQAWVNNPGFTKPGTGIDPIIGQGPSSPQQWQKIWGDPAAPKVDFNFHDFVHMKGGEYFFAPCISFLRTI